ncbi:hypothetical protein RM844_28145 [Streptomyces sp. DSM 44915]|uniref:Uncharacterized protein n=1 Tax=Streptomyces chisholmiae TaxID=3075540 RepID=A0ABU2JYV7_9ACTN|nr:hypothetical protein [Streptomyces sp. DSM 44915]MDT0270149.1 hypothetical protein [Streptomyces sp. DSM 44915]
METTGAGGPAQLAMSERPVDPRVPSQPGGTGGASGAGGGNGAGGPGGPGGEGGPGGPEEHIFGGGPPARLYLPNDWLNFLVDGDDQVAARRRYEQLMTQIFPNMPLDGHREIVDGLMLWREQLWTGGFLAHGVITVPARDGDRAAFWQILVAVMKLPATTAELDTSALMERMVGGSGMDYLTHVEKYQTDMGLGLGLIGRPPLTVPGGEVVRDSDGDPRRCGMAAALSYAPGAEFGIMAAGVSLVPEQDRQLATMVALIAGKSTLVTGDEGGGQENAAAPVPAAG